MSDLTYRSKKSNGYDDDLMRYFREGLMITPDRLTQLCFWIAEVDNAMVGCSPIEPIDNTTTEVGNFFIDPAHKSRGIGRHLWYELRSTAQIQGLTRVAVRAEPAAQQFFQSVGFKAWGEAFSRHLPGKMGSYMVCDI
ncbi:GNAT family N-acetyltransferase [Sulfitobacter sp.]|uniref:GNAT family N-acetyltransferase n=1 Tax=Sulfitobacter sp. TaxID=1903071 RepID=UPI0030030C25